jgi:SAM-dependent methyltransferase
LSTATDRLKAEQAFHDHQASHRAAAFREQPRALCFRDEDYLSHETWVRPAFRQLGKVSGRDVLDFGCGHGMAAVVLARRGAHVTALDLSPGYLAEARARAEANHVAVDWVQANGERLPLADRSFDRIWGNAILHHLDLERAGSELLRVLRPGGIAVFAEPWGENPLLNWVRGRLSYPGKQRTPDERPLDQRHVRLLQKVFPHVSIQGHQLLGMVRRVPPRGRWVAALDWFDDLLLARVPVLKRLCRYVVLTLRR